jgi:mono/diheme cytochrome c family protein
MRRVAKAALWTGGGLAAVLAGLVAFAHFGSDHKMNRRIEISPAAVAIPQDEAALARGKYLYESRGCTDCHGKDGLGRTLIDNGDLVVRGPNITSQGAVADYSVTDWVRSIRHGIAPDLRPLMVMPSEDYARMTDADLGAMIAYMRGLPPQPGDGRIVQLPLPVRFAYAAGIVRDAAEKIDHSLPPAKPAPADDILANGAYVANMCQGCHGLDLTGGKVPGGPPDWPPAANLTSVPGGGMQAYRDAGMFAAMLRSGRRPDGSEIQVMPFESLRELNDTEIGALYAYLTSLPPKGKS